MTLNNFRPLADHSPDVIVRYDRECRRVYVNPAYERAGRVTAAEVQGKRPSELPSDRILTGSTALDLENWLRRVIATAEPCTFDLTSTNEHGGTTRFELIAIPEFADDGEVASVLTVARDLTERHESERQLHELAQEFQALAENSPDTICRYTPDCRRIYANATFARLAGRSAKEVLGKRPSDFQDTVSAHAYEQTIQAVAASGETREFEYTWQANDVGEVTSLIRLAPEFGVNGEVISILAVGRDITTLKEAQQRLQEAEAMAGIGHWQWDFVHQESLVSMEICRLLGRQLNWKPSLDELLSLAVEEDRAAVSNAIQNAIDGKQHDTACSYRIRIGNNFLYVHMIARIEYGPDGTPSSLISTMQDVSDIKNTELRLQELARHDLITGLPNRNLLMERLYLALEKASSNNEMLGLLVVNLDRLKDVNDTHGHDIGDRLIFAFAERLRRQTRDCDTVAHLGGDRFALVLTRVRKVSNLGAVSRKIIEGLAVPFLIDDLELFVSASIGIGVFPSDGTTTVELLKNADSALNEAKKQGRGSFRHYSEAMSIRSRERAVLEAGLRRAEQEGEFELYFQPKLSLRQRRLVGAEALLRWHHPELGLLTPDKFIGIAEDTGLIVGIGIWVLTKACVAAQRWNASAKHKLRVAVNLSARQFRGNDLPATVHSILSATGCDPHWLELEITESLLLDNDSGVRDTLTELRGMGVTIAIDDFGTGYSALSYLKKFPIDVLKIDRSFVSGIAEDDFSSELVKAIISMGQCLGMEIVAEGVETEIQEKFVSRHSCHLGQGYLYSRPVPAHEFEKLEFMQKTRAKLAGSKGIFRTRITSATKSVQRSVPTSAPAGEQP